MKKLCSTISTLTSRVHGPLSCRPSFNYKRTETMSSKRNFLSRTQRHFSVIRLGQDAAEFHDDDKNLGVQSHALSVSLILSFLVAVGLPTFLLPHLLLSSSGHIQGYLCSALCFCSQKNESGWLILALLAILGLISMARTGSLHKTSHWSTGKKREMRVGKQ